jgi:hypothetical protein
MKSLPAAGTFFAGTQPLTISTQHANEQERKGMPHNVTLITTIAAAFGLALIFGFIAKRLKLPAPSVICLPG